ncbi:unnamed protein product [Protopolystoma xenopodis]|uniref:Uncharacterized protein n=1 Tax=Protopolystoma xenopodis TaxID=117903 RepID=A0A448XC50_9PLAT|nr:unnamed protein product [Protopolystoma xenopodis]
MPIKNEGQEYSELPYFIAYRRQQAEKLFFHARSKEHGLKHVDIRTGILAIFWLIVVALVFMLLIKLLSNVIIGYVSSPVATQIKAEHTSIIFPDVTICAKSPFNIQRKEAADSADAGETFDADYFTDLHSNVKRSLVDASLKLTNGSIQAAMLIQMATREGELSKTIICLICTFNASLFLELLWLT